MPEVVTIHLEYSRETYNEYCEEEDNEIDVCITKLPKKLKELCKRGLDEEWTTIIHPHYFDEVPLGLILQNQSPGLVRVELPAKTLEEFLEWEQQEAPAYTIGLLVPLPESIKKESRLSKYYYVTSTDIIGYLKPLVAILHPEKSYELIPVSIYTISPLYQNIYHQIPEQVWEFYTKAAFYEQERIYPAEETIYYYLPEITITDPEKPEHEYVISDQSYTGYNNFGNIRAYSTVVFEQWLDIQHITKENPFLTLSPMKHTLCFSEKIDKISKTLNKKTLSSLRLLGILDNLILQAIFCKKYMNWFLLSSEIFKEVLITLGRDYKEYLQEQATNTENILQLPKNDLADKAYFLSLWEYMEE